MPVITNKWVDKERKKRMHETAPSYASGPDSDDFTISTRKPEKRYSMSAKSTLMRTLRGVRK